MSSVRFDGVDARDVGGEAGGVDERGAGAGEVLHAAEEVGLLSGRGEKERLRLALAGFEGDAGVTHFLGEAKRVEIGERFVDDDRFEFGGFVHAVGGVGAEIAGGWLFDVLHAVVGDWRERFQLMKEFEKVSHVATTFVEVEREMPFSFCAAP